MMAQIGPLNPAVLTFKKSGWRTAAVLKTLNSATVRSIATKFGRMTQRFTLL